VAERIWPEKMNWVGGMRVAYMDFYRIVGHPVGQMTKKGCPKTRPEKTSNFD
jgi:hypothetical protein